MPATDEHLADRYGRSRARRRDRKLLISLGSTSLLAFLIWAAVTAVSTTNQVTAEVTSYEVLSPVQTQVNFVVTHPRNVDLSCAVQALNQTYTVVGYRVIDLPAVDATQTSANTTLNTVEIAVTGVVDRCWVR